MIKDSLMTVAVLFLTFVVLTACATADVLINSPGNKVTARVYVNNDGRLSYTLQRQGKTVLPASPMGITVDGTDLGKEVEINQTQVSTVNQQYPWRGCKNMAVNHYVAADIRINRTDNKQQGLLLQCRSYDDGFAYRYVVQGSGRRKINGESSGWQLPTGSEVWYQDQTHNYEGIWQSKKTGAIGTGEEKAQIGLPITVKLPDGTYIAATEGALFDYSGMTLLADGSNLLTGIFEDNSQGWETTGRIESPWRITMTGPDLDSLVNCDIVHNVCPSPDEKLYPEGIETDWIKPGRALWHWWSTGVPSFAQHKEWIDYTSMLGFEYYLIDEHWGKWTKDPETKWTVNLNDRWEMLAELCEYARKRGVGVWVWKACRLRNDIPGIMDPKARVEFFRNCRKSGVAGIKIDFMDSESVRMIDFYENALRDAARFGLMLNFHGANKPTGEPRTLPNEMTREGLRGLEYNKWSTIPRHHYAALPFTRLLAGHADFTPCTFNPEKIKGTTFCLQLATSILYTSPLMHWADRPELYLASPAIDIIRNIPSTWDQTRVLPGSEIGKVAGMARKESDQWFVGIVNGTDNVENYQLNLSFLGMGQYQARIARDKMDESAAMTVETTTVKSWQNIDVKMRPGGGFVAWFTRAQD